jgi:hypothetical protein
MDRNQSDQIRQLRAGPKYEGQIFPIVMSAGVGSAGLHSGKQSLYRGIPHPSPSALTNGLFFPGGPLYNLIDAGN